MTSMPKHDSLVITVVMAAYNAEAYIARAINSVQAQTFPDWELICIDDGSTDSTQSIIQTFAASDERIKLIAQANSGPAEARRKGYIAGVGEYFIMLDSDDWFGPEALENLLSEAKSNEADGVICRAMVSTTGIENWVSFHEQRGTMQGRRLSGQEAFALTFPWKIHGIGLWRKEVIKTVGVDPSNAFNRFNADEYLTRRLFLQCNRIVIGSGEYFIYPNRESITQKKSWRQFLSLETDRRLTDLALEVASDTQTVRAALNCQRQNMIRHVALFARYGGGGRSNVALSEIGSGLVHYLKIGSQKESRFSAFSILPLIIWHAARSFLGRFTFLRNLYYKIRPQS